MPVAQALRDCVHRLFCSPNNPRACFSTVKAASLLFVVIGIWRYAQASAAVVGDDEQQAAPVPKFSIGDEDDLEEEEQHNTGLQ